MSRNKIEDNMYNSIIYSRIVVRLKAIKYEKKILLVIFLSFYLELGF